MRIWMTSDGREIPYNELSDEHLCNILNLIESRQVWYFDGEVDKQDGYFMLRVEAMKRGLRWRQWEPRLKEGHFRRMGINPRSSNLSRMARKFDPYGQDSWEGANLGPKLWPYNDRTAPKPDAFDPGGQNSSFGDADIVELCTLMPGEKFAREGHSKVYMVCRAVGSLSLRLATEHRILVSNLQMGTTSLFPVNVLVRRVK